MENRAEVPEHDDDIVDRICVNHNYNESINNNSRLVHDSQQIPSSCDVLLKWNEVVPYQNLAKLDRKMLLPNYLFTIIPVFVKLYLFASNVNKKENKTPILVK